MAGETGAETSRLDEVETALRDEPWRFDFFQAVRRIEAARMRCPRIGTSARPADDPVRFGQLPSLAFAPSTVARYVPGSDGRAPRLLELFFGLLGPNGPLPLHLTDYAQERISPWRDATLARFLDVFHHRMLSFFYRAWAIARPTASCDRPASDWYNVRFSGALLLALRMCARTESDRLLQVVTGVLDRRPRTGDMQLRTGRCTPSPRGTARLSSLFLPRTRGSSTHSYR